ncbi:MAG TPA: NTP transferase domain-containing protein [Tetrasphaera sp.]|uniref:nucleotidyltransferase family protein n=1 Tax=Nostocoides sp. TaxID=1917966 RepID=UPI002B944BF8|nr:NTP transferase domain-containing protein [Tetrasphaera sp.]HNQ05557.1 NTP transferase domain-containing protein [Tetrasphaera sp.]
MCSARNGRVHTVGVVLAAGAGRRFGGPKILAHQGHWLEQSVAALRNGGCHRVAVCMGAAVVDAPPGVLAVEVPDWESGMSASVRAALDLAAELDAELLVLHLIDLPDVGAPVVARVLESAAGRPDALVRAAYGNLPGHPVVVGRDHLAPMRATLTGDSGGRDYLAAAGAQSIACGDLATGADHDVPESLA